MKAQNIVYDLSEAFFDALDDARHDGDISAEYHAQIEALVNAKEGFMVPCTVDWCPSCGGSGKMSYWDTRKDLDMSRMVEMSIEDGDYEFVDDYMHSNKYDVACTSCNGTKIHNIVDFEGCNDIQKFIIEMDNEARSWANYSCPIAEQERRMGA